MKDQLLKMLLNERIHGQVADQCPKKKIVKMNGHGNVLENDLRSGTE
jgi:hypothetical protein